MPNGTATCFTRMPHDLVESIAHCAAKEDRSMSSILQVQVREALEARGAYPPKAQWPRTYAAGFAVGRDRMILSSLKYKMPDCYGFTGSYADTFCY